LIAHILLAATVYRTGVRRAIPLIVSFASVFVVLGGPYFAWRWHYFGAPLPNPFYVKGGRPSLSCERDSVFQEPESTVVPCAPSDSAWVGVIADAQADQLAGHRTA
jgi:hypothetical protein